MTRRNVQMETYLAAGPVESYISPPKEQWGRADRELCMTPTAFRALRTAAGLTQVELAERLGLTARTIRRWETGATPVPRPVALLMAAQARAAG